MDVFHKIVKKHLVGAGIEVESQVTEKEGENSLEEIAKRLDLDSYDAVVVLGGDSSLRDIVNGLWEKAGKPDPKVNAQTSSIICTRDVRLIDTCNSLKTYGCINSLI